MAFNIKRKANVPYPEKFKSVEDAWEYCRRLYENIETERSSRVEDFGSIDRLVPEGVIVAWNPGYYTDGSNTGYTVVIPTANTVAAANTYLNERGWYVCNGAAINVAASRIHDGAGRYIDNLTTDRFLMGDTVAGAIGGSATMAHTHGYGTIAAAGESTHTHAVGTIAAAGESTHTHGVGTLDAAAESTHTHQVVLAGYWDCPSGGSDAPNAGTYTSGAGSSHDHALSGDTGAGASHTHTMSGSTAAGASHTHTMSGDTGAASASSIVPTYLSTIYIKRLW